MIAGIDVSQWQGEIDWATVAGAGCKFVFMKATEGATWTDPRFEFNRAEAQRVGIPAGAYHYFRSSSEVKDQVANFVRVVGEIRKGELPPVLDVEDPQQWKGKSKAELTTLVLQWLEGVESGLGKRPFVYLSPAFAEEMLDQNNSALGEYPLWLAHWTESQPRVPKPWALWTFWQYSSKGHMPGITANVVDLDRFAGTDEELERFASVEFQGH